MRGARALALLACLSAAPVAASTLFSDGFEACCTVGGTVSGLAGSGLVLQLDAGAVQESLAIGADGRYRFRAVLAAGTGYSVSVQSQPAAGPSCAVVNGSGVIAAAAIGDIDVRCSYRMLWDSGSWGQDWH